MEEQDEYARLTAIVIHALIYKDVIKRFPRLCMKDHDVLVLSIIDRVARLRGSALRSIMVNNDGDDE
jgi:hypothetical protein